MTKMSEHYFNGNVICVTAAQSRSLEPTKTYLNARLRKSELDGQRLSSRDVRILASQERSFQPFELLRGERGPASPLFPRNHNARFGRHVHVAGPSFETQHNSYVKTFSCTKRKYSLFYVYLMLYYFLYDLKSSSKHYTEFIP